MVWGKQSDHASDCYFCMTNIKQFFRKNKSIISYPVCKSVIKPAPHDIDLPVPPPTKNENILSVDKGASTGTKHNSVHWRLFIDSGKTSLKAMLLHNGNIKPSISVNYSILKKETFDTIKILLDFLEYPK